jgi:hypothetical protein
MRVKPLLPAAGLLVVAGCAGHVTVPSAGIDHPANPHAAAAPLPTPPMIPVAEKTLPAKHGMQGMNHGSLQGMQGMEHKGMEGMKRMEGMQHDH